MSVVNIPKPKEFPRVVRQGNHWTPSVTITDANDVGITQTGWTWRLTMGPLGAAAVPITGVIVNVGGIPCRVEFTATPEQINALDPTAENYYEIESVSPTGIQRTRIAGPLTVNQGNNA